jgi:NTE family protein
MPSDTPRRAIVFSGGGARGAYEAGVLRYVLSELPRRLGRPLAIELVSGTSVGALHACFMAATAHMGLERADMLARPWEQMRLADLFGSAAGELLRLPRRLFKLLRTPAELRSPRPPDRLYGLLDTHVLEQMVLQAIPWRSIARNVATGRVESLCVAATEIATGRVVVFIDGRKGSDSRWHRDAGVVARPARIGPTHALASAAIPLVFPAVRVGQTYYADGGLRLNTPLAPVLRLGADRVLVIPLRRGPTTGEAGDRAARRIEQYGNPLFLYGKVLDALLLDRIDADLAQLRLINDILRQQQALGGTELAGRVGEALERDRGQRFHVVDDVVVRPSQDLGVLAAQVAREQQRSADSPLLRLVLRMLGVSEHDPFEADLLSYLFFDRSYTSTLLDLGYSDAQRQQEELARFFAD